MRTHVDLCATTTRAIVVIAAVVLSGILVADLPQGQGNHGECDVYK